MPVITAVLAMAIAIDNFLLDLLRKIDSRDRDALTTSFCDDVVDEGHYSFRFAI